MNSSDIIDRNASGRADTLSAIGDGREQAVTHTSVNYSVNNCRAKSGFRAASYKRTT